MSEAIRDAARVLLDELYYQGYNSQAKEECEALEAVLSAPQPTANERVAEHMEHVLRAVNIAPEDLCSDDYHYLGIVEQSARALLSASQEDAEHAAMYRFTRKMSADHGIDYMRRCDTEDQIDAAIRAAMSAKETK